MVRFGGRWIVLNPRDSQSIFKALNTPDKYFRWKVRWLVGWGYLFNWSTPPGVLLNISHSGLEQPDYGKKALQYGWRCFFFLHDLIPITHPEYCRVGQTQKHEQRLQTMFTAGCGIVVNSWTTARELAKYAEHHKLYSPPCLAAFLAPATLLPPSPSPLLDKSYFVILGTIESRKNHLLLLNIWRELVEEMGDNAPRLVIIGQRGWEYEQVVDVLERCVALQGFVIEKSHCSDDELASWLAHARALLFPSFVEGFGIPLIEAFKVNLPVIASNLPVFREIAGEIPDYINPLDGLGWKQMIMDYALPESPMRKKQCERIKGFKVPTWENHFAAVEAFMASILNHA